MASFGLKGLLSDINEDEELSEEEDPSDLYFTERDAADDSTPLWDSFIDKPMASGSSSEIAEKFMETALQFLKLLTYLLVFVVVFTGTVLSKGIVLFMTSQLKVNRTVPICSSTSRFGELNPNKNYIAELPLEENVVWAWYLLFLYSVPEIGTFLRSFRMKLFKMIKSFSLAEFAIVLLMETLHTIGVGLLIYVVFPNLDVIKGAMLTCSVAFLPSVLNVLSRFSTRTSDSLFPLNLTLDIFCVISQMSGMFVFALIKFFDENEDDNWKFFVIPVAVLLTSIGWWENYINENSLLYWVKDSLKNTRYSVYLFMSIWKVLVMFVVMIISMGISLGNFEVLFNMEAAFTNHVIIVREQRNNLSITASSGTVYDHAIPMDPATFYTPNHYTPLYVFLIAASMSYVSYIFGKFACKIQLQGFSFAFPICLSVPVTVMGLSVACGYRFDDICGTFTFLQDKDSHLFWNYGEGQVLHGFLSNDFEWLWMFWLLSQIWVTFHIWNSNSERLASTEKLFVTPMYSSIIVDQSLALNRRREPLILDEEEDDDDDAKSDEYVEINPAYETNVKSAHAVTRIFGCATMWHETGEEMKAFLKSIMRLDEDQCSRRMAQQYLNIIDKDYYEFETHVMFDDAFEVGDENEHVVNSYVKILLDTVEDAASYVHRTNVRLRPPKKVPTPYGGRLVWTLPGKTKLIVHLKDKDKIRHKKRWSQVMYMYYILGYKLMDTEIPIERKELMAENTYLLALDGDIDFTPKAVLLLTDLMKKNLNVGAACSRIHPVGSGLMVWYQMFEYAVGHWMQKATEHVIGCVLCSPGCFSLFRGKALMDENVMAKYTTKSSQARHYVQFDQGEDRWLCTLLLQRGYRVEYSAAADSYTNSPEAFAEFYNQRRRWTPSTMANIIDLLSDYKNVVKRNENISMLYIAYQGLLLFGTALGPGTIFMMIVGSFTTAFPTMDNYTAFFINFIPIFLFCLSCMTMKSKTQIGFAYILSALYALVMMIVLIGMFVNFVDDGFNSPTSLFFLTSAAVFIITAILHPQEFICLLAGAIYYMLVPSMYLLLQIYSCYNLNDVSWGTRDAPVKKTKMEQEQEEQKLAEEAAKKSKGDNGLLGYFFKDKTSNDKGSFELSFAGLFKLMCCVQKQNDDKVQIAQTLQAIQNKLDAMDPNKDQPNQLRRHSSLRSRVSNAGLLLNPDNEEIEYPEEVVEKNVRDIVVNPYWIEDKSLTRGEVDYLSTSEITFWRALIEKYLHPLIKNKETEQKVANDLKELRNLVVFTFTMVNAIFALVIFLLQLNQDKIYINWFLGVTANVTYNYADTEVVIAKEYLHLEPIGMLFLVSFSLLLTIQFLAMLVHRFGTFSHILAITSIKLFNCKKETDLESGEVSKLGIDYVREMQKLNREDEDDDKKEEKNVSRRKTLHNIEINRAKKPAVTSLDESFRTRHESFAMEGKRNSVQYETILNNMNLAGKRRDTMHAMINTGLKEIERRKSVAIERRKSVAIERRKSKASFNDHVTYHDV